MAPLLLLPLLLLFPPAGADPPYKLCDGGNYSVNSTFGTNLNLLLASLSLSSANSTFAKDTKGSILGPAYGLFLCRGDIDTSDCYNCVQNAIQSAPQLCSLATQVTVWYNTCQLRYSDISFFSSFSNKNYEIYRNGSNATNPSIFSKYEGELMSNLTIQATNKSSIRFSRGKIIYRGNQSQIFGLVQCTRDLSTDSCYRCLQEILDFYGRCCQAMQGGGILSTSCNFRYEDYKFFEGEPSVLLVVPPEPAPGPSSSLPQSPPFTPRGKNDGKGKKAIIIISVILSILVAFVLIFAVCILFKRKSVDNSNGMENPEEISTTESLHFDLSILKVATANFSFVNKLGQGGFGAVYKGTLPNGEEIAVKRLSANSRQGIQELKNELVLVAKLQHRNLVRLRGVCLEEGEKLLVYEYMPNGSLDKFLFDPIKRTELNWERRFKIIGGIARGLLYLHEESRLKIIHRDLKASNVLLDGNMKPKISDFGLARLFGGDETLGFTNRVVGTFGYMAPEYARYGRVSTKLDVYSYGILVLEIILGRRNSTVKYDSEPSQDVLSYTWKHWRNGSVLEIIDRSLGEDYSRNEVLRCIQIGLLCAQEFPSDRPSMSLVFLMLNSPTMPLHDPAYPSGLSTEVSVVSSQRSYFGSTDKSSTSSMGSSQQSGTSIMSNSLETRRKGKELITS